MLTDLEGPAGVDKFTQTRKPDAEGKTFAMKRLAGEVNACMAGIRAADPDAAITVWDGHGSGGLLPEDLDSGCRYLPPGGRPVYELAGYDGVLFVGQHAMAGTVFAPLCHTYNSRMISYYQLNGCFIGEFGARALVAGSQGVPVIFLAGDDKAAAEARMFIPELVTAVTKKGTGLESADHLAPEEACALIRSGAEEAVRRIKSFKPFQGFQAPYVFEAGYYAPVDTAEWKDWPGEVTFPDGRTVRIATNRLEDLPF